MSELSGSIDLVRRECLSRLDSIRRDFSEMFPELMVLLEEGGNDALPLRAYVTLRKGTDAEGREVAISIEAKSSEVAVLVDFDVCFDDGELISSGSSIAISFAEMEEIDDARSIFLKGFEKFWGASKEDILRAASQL